MLEPEQRTLPAILAHNAEQYGERNLLHDESGALTYQQVFSLARRVAFGLASIGVERNDRVALMLDNRREFLFTWFGLGLIGAVEVPVNQQNVGDRLVHILNHSESETLVVQREYVEQVYAVRSRLTCLKRMVVVGGDVPVNSQFDSIPWEELEVGREFALTPLRFSDPVAVMYTSGSTGPAKGAVLSHGHHYVNGFQAVTSVGITSDDVLLIAMPLHHNMAQGYGIWPAMVAAAAVRLTPRFDKRTFWDDVRASGATVLPFIGAMLVLLSKNSSSPEDSINPLRIGFGVPIPADLHRAFEKRFCLRLVHCYGSTEATIVAWGNDPDSVPGAVGRVFAGYDVQIHDNDDRALPTGTVGEICVRPSEPYAMFSEYLKDPVKTARAFRNAWFHTGDRGWYDTSDRLWFKERIGDAIRCKGENISAQEVEDAFIVHPALSLVAAYGVPGDLGDEEVVIVVVPQAEAVIEPEDLLKWSADKLPKYAMPRYVEIADELPLTPTGKIEKYKLRERGLSPRAYDARRRDSWTSD
jgi:carnitine-CoA ligase